MKRLKRIFALLLVVTLVATMQGTHVLAQTTTEETETLSQSEGTEEETIQEVTEEETVQKVEEQSVLGSRANVKESESESASTTEKQEEMTETSPADPYVLPEIKFVYAETMELDVPGTQNIVLGFKEDVNVDSPKVRYRIGDSEKVYTMDLERQAGNVLRFSEDYLKDSPPGIYSIIGYSFEVDGQYHEVDFKEEFITTYSVGEAGAITENENLLDITDVDSLADLESAGSHVEASIIEIEDELSASDISSALASAQTIAGEEGVTLKSAVNSQIRRAASNGNLVVVLAPGHCAAHNVGASRGRLNEVTLGLEIAKYAKAELETYAGVSVYLSQTTERCERGTNLSTCLSGHADFAKSVGADVLISLHINSTGNETDTATGAEAIITLNSNYYSSMYNLSSSILAELEKVGLANRRIFTKESDGTSGTYSTGQLADYYSVIRNSILQGIPAFILEHAFINNASDQELLSSASGLRSIGIADATGIAKYYGLSKRPPVTSEQRALIAAFVTRLYQNILGRSPSGTESTGWINVLVNRQETGAQVVMGFINSQEFTARKVNNSNYVEILYQTMLNRASDKAGKTSWVNLLDVGMSRYHIASGFTNSSEFDAICKKYGIDRGTLTSTEPRDQNEGYTRFVSRLYTKALNRSYDVNGLNAWTNVLIKGTNTYEQVAENFIFSLEFTQRKLGNTEYVKVLYRTFFDREPSNSEVTAWVNAINRGETRRNVLYGFSRSTEFQVLCRKYRTQ